MHALINIYKYHCIVIRIQKGASLYNWQSINKDLKLKKWEGKDKWQSEKLSLRLANVTFRIGRFRRSCLG